MKLKPGMAVTVKLNDEEYQFLLVHTDGNGKNRLSLKAPLARVLGGMGIGDILTWQVQAVDGETVRVELVKVEEAK